MGQHGTESLSVLLALSAVFGCVSLAEGDEQYEVLTAGVVGVIVYLAVSWISSLLEEEEPDDEDDTTEAGASATFGVVLTSQPTADVTIAVASSDSTEGTRSSIG